MASNSVSGLRSSAGSTRTAAVAGAGQAGPRHLVSDRDQGRVGVMGDQGAIVVAIEIGSKPGGGDRQFCKRALERRGRTLDDCAG